MSRMARENILATYGNQGLFPAGQDVFALDGTLNASPGQMFIWNMQTRKSLGAGITTATNDRIVISVAVDNVKFRSVFGDQLFGNAISAATASAPTCGVADIWDLYWDCLECGDAVSVNITVKDDKSFTEYPYNRGATYSHTMKMDDCPCDSCGTPVNQFALACKIRDTINAHGLLDSGKRPIFNKKNFNEDIPYTAHVLYGGNNAVVGTPATNPTTKVYCIDPKPASGCVGCISVNGPVLTTFSFNGGAPIAFKFVSNPANPAETLLSQLDYAATQITTALAGNGSAVVTKGAGACCSYRLEVNTCYTDFALTGYVPCENYNPFATPSLADTSCLTCAAPPVGKAWKYGVRIVSKPVNYDCKCFPNLDGISLMIRTLQVNVKGFENSSSFVRQVSKAAAPENMGYQWVKRDFKSDNGGDGRGHDAFTHLGYGSIGTGLLGRGREDVMTICDTSYCSYDINHSLPYKDTGIHGNLYATRGRSIVLIPSSDLITIADFEGVFNPYLISSGGGKLAVTCNTLYPHTDEAGVALQPTVDQTQIEFPTRFNDPNGFNI